MQVSKISILGSGWLGLPLAENFISQGAQVKLSTTSTDKMKALADSGAKVFQVEVKESSEVPLNFLDSDLLIVNITCKDLEGFRNLIKQIESSSVSKVIFVSSTSVYPNTNDIVSEDQGIELQDHKLYQIEKLFLYNPNFDTNVIRFSGLVGYQRQPGRFFNKKPIPSPTAKTNLIHRDDCIGIFNKMLANNIWGEVFNGCSDTHPSKSDFYTKAALALGLNAPELNNDGDPAYKIVSNEKIKSLLAYEFKYPDLMATDLSQL